MSYEAMSFEHVVKGVRNPPKRGYGPKRPFSYLSGVLPRIYNSIGQNPSQKGTPRPRTHFRTPRTPHTLARAYIKCRLAALEWVPPGPGYPGTRVYGLKRPFSILYGVLPRIYNSIGQNPSQKGPPEPGYPIRTCP